MKEKIENIRTMLFEIDIQFVRMRKEKGFSVAKYLKFIECKQNILSILDLIEKEN